MLGIFGNIANPFVRLAPGSSLASSNSGSGLVTLITILFRFSIIVAGLYTLINIVLAGYGFLSAGGDSKLIQKSWERIWRSVVGLLIIACSVLFASMHSWILFRDTSTIINPQIFRP